MKKLFLFSILSVAVSYSFADSMTLYSNDDVIWTPSTTIIRENAATAAPLGPLCAWNSNPNRSALCKQQIGTDLSHVGFSSWDKLITIYQSDGQHVLAKLYPAKTLPSFSGECNFSVVLNGDGSVTVNVADKKCAYETFQPQPETKKNSLSLKVNGTTAWAPIVKIGDEAVKPDLCAANTNPDLADQTQKLCKLWYNSDKSSVDVNGSETRNIKIYDRKNQSKLLIDLQTAATSDTNQCDYTVTFNEKAASDSKYQVNVADAKCKFTILP